MALVIGIGGWGVLMVIQTWFENVDSSMMIRPRISSSIRMKSFMILSTITSTSWTTFAWFKSLRMFASVRKLCCSNRSKSKHRSRCFPKIDRAYYSLLPISCVCWSTWARNTCFHSGSSKYRSIRKLFLFLTRLLIPADISFMILYWLMLIFKSRSSRITICTRFHSVFLHLSWKPLRVCEVRVILRPKSYQYRIVLPSFLAKCDSPTSSPSNSANEAIFASTTFSKWRTSYQIVSFVAFDHRAKNPGWKAKNHELLITNTTMIPTSSHDTQ